MVEQEEVGLLIEKLILFGLYNGMLEELDIPLVRNQLMVCLGISNPFDFEKNGITKEDVKKTVDDSSPLSILEPMLAYAAEKELIGDNITEKDLFDAKLMGCLMPRPSEINRRYQEIKKTKGNVAATDYFYKLSQDSNYIRMDRIRKNRYWLADTEYGELEITINLSKPEKDPKEIAKAKLLPQAGYPKCLLCLENVGYPGRLNHPGRSNHRVLPLTLDKEQWYFQYSPYVYYNEHSIIFKGKHEPMKIQKRTFKRLLDFVEEMPHYFLGSNADLPIVGGSILSHDHFQGGRHEFPMEKAPIIIEGKDERYPNVQIGIVKWPLSVIRLSSKEKEDLIEAADNILNQWREYTDALCNIFAYTKADNEIVAHNTITPIGRCNRSGLYELDLVLRNNRQNEEHPDGIFHPHQHLHHIKKENIGLIEVMGLAVLPARLERELHEIEVVLTGEKEVNQFPESMASHLPWLRHLVDKYGNSMEYKAAKQLIQDEVGCIFLEVLACAGVYKKGKEGLDGFCRFLKSTGIEICK